MWVWLWRVLWVLCCSLAVSLAAFCTLYVVVWWCVVVAPVPTWLGGSALVRSLRRQRRVHEYLVERGDCGGSRGGRRRALHDYISLLIVAAPIIYEPLSSLSSCYPCPRKALHPQHRTAHVHAPPLRLRSARTCSGCP